MEINRFDPIIFNHIKMDNNDILALSKKQQQRQDAFEKRLLEIEQEFIHYFKSKPSLHPEQKHLRICDKMDIMLLGIVVTLIDSDEEHLPIHIRNKVVSAFVDTFTM